MACIFTQPSATLGQCVSFNLGALPSNVPITLNDSWPEPYFLSAPCAGRVLLPPACNACSSVNLSSTFAVQLDGKSGCAGTRCFRLGNTATAPSVTTAASGGDPLKTLSLTSKGGDDDRAITWDFVCDATLSKTALPTGLVVESSENYHITWRSPLACGTLIKAGPQGCSPGPPAPAPPTSVAQPTKSQLTWMQDEVAAIGHFNMGTFEACGIGIEGNGIAVPPPSTFAPTNVDVEGWLQALKSFGAKHAVLVVSHGCGFNTFPSRTAFPEFDFVYNYTVASSPWKSGKGDIAAMFVAACQKYGIRPAFYHGAMNNAFLNVRSGVVGTSHVPGQAVVTQDQYTKILLANLRQLWTDYGELAEVWFDGGYPIGTETLITDLLKELQPNAVAFQGPGANIVRWVGTESGHAAYPCWSANSAKGVRGSGAFGGPVFDPAEADTCFQGSKGGKKDEKNAPSAPYGGCWFFNNNLVPKTLAELVDTYHLTVGSNALLLLDWSPNQTGGLRADHVRRYNEFGGYIASCYQVAPVAALKVPVTIATAGDGAVLLLPAAGSSVDRVVLMEDQTSGQRIQAFTLSFKQTASDASWTEIAITPAGSSIGHKRIVLLPTPLVNAYAIAMNVTSGVLGNSKAAITHFEARNCSRTPIPTGCSALKDFAYKIVASITLKVAKNLDVTQCCLLCRSTTGCAVFVHTAAAGCTILSANQGGDAESGTTSGAPL